MTAQRYSVKKTTASLQTRDGIRLDADVYTPDTTGQFPVLLMRQPYGRAIASTVVYAHPDWYASHGYIVVIQDVRGRGSSQGNFIPFSPTEVSDGEDTIHWAAQLPQSNGKVGMYGFSYQGMTQLYAAQSQPEPLKVLCPGMVGYDLYSDWAYENGAFYLQASLSWAVQLAAETARIHGDINAHKVLFTAARDLSYYDPSPRFSESFRKYVPGFFYYHWLNHPQPDHYWAQFKPDLTTVDLPMLHIGGWFDPYLRGTLRLYEEMQEKTHSLQHLLIGPWVHIPWGRKAGSVNYGPEAISPVDPLQLRWFNYFLKEIETDIHQTAPVCLFEMGTNQWRYFEQFPNPSPTAYYLTTTGLASVREDSGQLTPTVPQTPGQDTFVHDPWRPVPALGGHASYPAGSFDRTHLDCRNDVLTYTSDPLTEDLYLAGEVAVEVDCVADHPSFDLCAILCQVTPDGKVYNFTQGYIRLYEATTPVKIPLQATCICVPVGYRLRLSLSAACYPAYPVNVGTDKVSNEVNFIDAPIITLRVRCGSEFPAQVLLPKLTAEQQKAEKPTG